MSWVNYQIVSIWLVLGLKVCPCMNIKVTGFSGQNVTLPCKYNFKYHGKCEICWMQGDIPNIGCGNEIIASDGDKVVRQTSQRYQLDEKLQNGDASLTIYNTSLQDSGRYGCRVHIPGWFNDVKIIVNVIILDRPSSTTEEKYLLPRSPVTLDPWPTIPTHETSTGTRYDSNSSTPDTNKAEKELTDDALPVTVVSILLILLVFGIAAFLIWKKKRRSSEASEIDQNSNSTGSVSAIYNNSEVSLGLNHRSLAVENIYQLDTENEHE